MPLVLPKASATLCRGTYDSQLTARMRTGFRVPLTLSRIVKGCLLPRMTPSLIRKSCKAALASDTCGACTPDSHLLRLLYHLGRSCLGVGDMLVVYTNGFWQMISVCRKSIWLASTMLRYALSVDGRALFPTYTVVPTVRSLKQTVTVGSFTPAL